MLCLNSLFAYPLYPVIVYSVVNIDNISLIIIFINIKNILDLITIYVYNVLFHTNVRCNVKYISQKWFECACIDIKNAILYVGIALRYGFTSQEANTCRNLNAQRDEIPTDK